MIHCPTFHLPKSRRPAAFLAAVSIAASALAAPAVAADTLNAKCASLTFMPKVGPVSITYGGGESGKMIVKSTLGDMQLDAKRSTRDAASIGETGTLIIVNGHGTAQLSLPDQSAVVACMFAMGKKLEVTDAAGVLDFMPSCIMSTPASAQPVPMSVSVNTMTSEGELMAEFVLTYPDKHPDLTEKTQIALMGTGCTIAP